MYQPALAPASPKGGKWSFRTLKGLVRRRGRWVHVHVLVNILYTKFKLIISIHSCNLNRCMAGHQPASAPALPEGGKWSIRILKGWVSCEGWRGSIHAPVSYHSKICQILMLMLGLLSILYIISYHIISYHIISYHIISYHISYHISYQSYHVSYHMSYHISYHIIPYIISYIIYIITSYHIIYHISYIIA